MHRIRVKYLNIYYDLTRKREEFVAFDDYLTLGELLNKISGNYKPKFRDSVLDKENKLIPHVWVLLNRRVTKDLETELKDGDLVVLGLPLVGG